MPLNVPPQVAPGFVDYFAASVPPAGWLECNGAAISRTTYAALFLAIGTTFGAGDGSTTFSIPDCRGEFIRGWDHGRGVDSARGIGTGQGAGVRLTGGTGGADSFLSPNAGTKTLTGSGGSTFGYVTVADGGGETRPRNVAMLTCIKF